jgi:hypothetical protein
VLRRSLLDLNNQLEALRGELARQRGGNEQLARDVADIAAPPRTLPRAWTNACARLEPQKVAFDGREFKADPDEKRQYEEAFGLLRGGDFGAAALSLTGFLQRWPHSGYGDAVRFWLGSALYGSEGPRKRSWPSAPSSTLPLTASARARGAAGHGQCQIESKDTEAAPRTLDTDQGLPRSEAAQAAKERLAALK